MTTAKTDIYDETNHRMWTVVKADRREPIAMIGMGPELWAEYVAHKHKPGDMSWMMGPNFDGVPIIRTYGSDVRELRFFVEVQ